MAIQTNARVGWDTQLNWCPATPDSIALCLISVGPLVDTAARFSHIAPVLTLQQPVVRFPCSAGLSVG